MPPPPPSPADPDSRVRALSAEASAKAGAAPPFSWIQASAIVLAGAWALSPAFRGPWLWDDDQYITQNLALHSTAGLWKNWIAPTTVNYFPLTTTVQWFQWQSWGDNPAGYHATNIALHLISALLLWRLLQRLGVRFAWLGGLIFAVHPLVVESVAWISELKNTLSLPPLLLAMGCFIDYDDGVSKRRSYLLSLLWFLAAMLCKSTVVMLPAVLLLYCWWKRGKLRVADLRASAAFFAISLALGLVTVVFEHHRSMSGVTSVPSGGLVSRAADAGLAVVFYFCKSAVPRGLTLIYPRWTAGPSLFLGFLSWVLLGAVLAWLWSRRPGWGRPALLGLGFFVLNLLPVLGFVPIAYQDISWVADHFAYLPLIGLVGLAAAAFGPLQDRSRKASWFVAAVIIAALAVETHGYARIFADAESLWSHAARHNPDSWVAEDNLGLVLAGDGRLPEAIAHFERALQLKPDAAEVENNLGLALANSGRLEEAIAHYEAALRLSPGFPEVCNNLGLALARSDRTAEAIVQFEQALRLRPDYAEAHRNLGLVLARAGRIADAIAELEQAIRLKPDYDEARNNLGAILRAAGRDQR